MTEARTNVYERLMAWANAQSFHHVMPEYVLVDRNEARALAEQVRAVAVRARKAMADCPYDSDLSLWDACVDAGELAPDTTRE